MSVPYQFAIRRYCSFFIRYEIAGSFCRISPVLLCCLLGLTLAGCPSVSPPIPPGTSSPSSQAYPSTDSTAKQRQAYAKAETLRANGRFAQARLAYANFVQRYPASPLTDDALLAMARVATTLADDRGAQTAYENLLTRFPGSELIPQAYLELGISYHRIQDLKRSLTTLRQVLTRSPSQKQLALTHYHLGLIAFEQQQFINAIESLRISAETSPDDELVTRARAQTDRIVHDHLTPPDLKQLVRKYPTAYPGDVALLQLAQIYRDASSRMDEMATLQHFTATFVDHPQTPKAIVRLRDLQASLTTDRTKIGVLLPLSGEVGQYGQNTLRGIELALAALQERHPEMALSLVVRDSHNDGVAASDALRSLVTDAHVVCVVGPLFSQVALDLAPIAEQLQVPLVSPYAPDGEFPTLSTYAFRNSMTDDLQAGALAEYAVYTLNLRRFAILYPDEPYGVTFKDRFIEHVIQLGGEVVVVVPYPPDANDFSAQIKQLGGINDTTLRDLRAGAETVADGSNSAQLRPPLFDAIFIPGFSDKVGLIAPALAFYNITGVQLLGSDGWNAPEIVDIGEHFVEGAVFVDGFFAASPTPLVQEFVERYQARYHEMPDLLAAQGYDTIWLLAQTLLEGAETRTRVRDKLLSVQNLAGVSGMISMRPSGDAGKMLYLLSVQNGQIMQLN